MRRIILLPAGLFTLALLWAGPLPQLAARYFSAHMTLHMGVVAVAAPLVAFGLTGGRIDPTRTFPALFSAVPASVVELVVVWAWHAPALHHAARGTRGGLIAEQGTFLLAALLVWISAFGSGRAGGRARAGAGIVALLLTSMHMTLLGALLALAPRPLYAHGAALTAPAAALDDQHLGGAIMLIVGGASYLAGGLWLSASLLASGRARQPGEIG